MTGTRWKSQLRRVNYSLPDCLGFCCGYLTAISLGRCTPKVRAKNLEATSLRLRDHRNQGGTQNAKTNLLCGCFVSCLCCLTNVRGHECAVDCSEGCQNPSCGADEGQSRGPQGTRNGNR